VHRFSGPTTDLRALLDEGLLPNAGPFFYFRIDDLGNYWDERWWSHRRISVYSNGRMLLGLNIADIDRMS
jgi:hypothetical protein